MLLLHYYPAADDRLTTDKDATKTATVLLQYTKYDFILKMSSQGKIFMNVCNFL